MKTLEKLQGTKLVKKSGELTINVKSAIFNSTIKNNKIYPCYYTGQGRHIRLIDYSSYILSVLNKLGYKYTLGNDAVRGGKNGNYIKMSKVAIKALMSLK